MPFDPSRLPRSAGGAVVVGLAFDVDRFVAPAEDIPPLVEEAWGDADVLRSGATMSALWLKNGLRVGVITAAQRDYITERMREAEARAEQLSRAVQSGFPLTLDLGLLAESTTVFKFNKNGRLDGSTFGPGAARRLQIDYRAAVENQSVRIVLQMTPEMFKESASPRYRTDGERIEYRQVYEGTLFHGLRAALDIEPGEWLMVGVADVSENRFTLGDALLRENDDGRRWETLLLIGPRLFRAEHAGDSP